MLEVPAVTSGSYMGRRFLKNNMGFGVPGLDRPKQMKHDNSRGSYRLNDRQMNSADAAARPEPRMGITGSYFLGSVLLVCSSPCHCRAMASYTSAVSTYALRREHS